MVIRNVGRLINGIFPINDAARAPFIASKSLRFFLFNTKKEDGSSSIFLIA
jgi:hypothetical protein